MPIVARARDSQVEPAGLMVACATCPTTGQRPGCTQSDASLFNAFNMKSHPGGTDEISRMLCEFSPVD
jgi:hypothetical protein